MTHTEYLSTVAFANKCNDEYYKNNNSIVSDASFDIMIRDLELFEQKHPELVAPDSPTVNVGSDLVSSGSASGFAKVKHDTPMLSLQKAYTIEEVLAWRDGIAKKIGHNPRLSCEFKYDGLSISLKYVEGELVQALTRGDGHEGLDVTSNVLVMKGLPKHFSDFNVAIPREFEVRGEILMSFSAFEHCNKARLESGEALYANPRNAASGILRNQSNRDLMKHLSLYAWQYLPDWGTEMLEQSDHLYGMQQLRSLGFAVAGLWEALGDASITKCIENIAATRESLKSPIDGVVFKVADKSVWEQLGVTEHHPNCAIAYKFPAKEDEGNVKTTRLLDIEFSMAQSGKITPVAVTDEVLLYGTKVHHFNIASYNLFMVNGPWRIGDTLVVTKGGEITPKILQHKKDGEGELIMFPKTCPHCGSPITIDGALAFCKNPECEYKQFTPKVKRDAKISSSMNDMFAGESDADTESFNKSALIGKKVVVSGTFNGTYNRSQLEHLVTQCGGTLQASVGKSTSFIVAGDNMGPSKRQKAAQLGVKIIGEQEFVQMITA